MSLIKTYLHEQDSMIELYLTLNQVEYIISYLEETDDTKANIIADDIRTQTYA